MKKSKIFKLLIGILGMSTAFSRVIVFSVVLTILIVLPTAKLYLLPVRSLYENIFHFKPYSSGMTRSVSMILHGQLGEAIGMNPLGFLLVVVVAVILVKDIVFVLRKRDFSV